MNRAGLVQRKAEVQAEIARLRRQLEAGGQDRRRAGQIAAQIESLQGEEHRLRLLIDRSR
jgi:hypothetical protein